jgi:hypothetical protein
MRCQAVARSVDQVQPDGIFRIFLRAWVTRRAGAEKIRSGRVLPDPCNSKESNCSAPAAPGSPGIAPGRAWDARSHWPALMWVILSSLRLATADRRPRCHPPARPTGGSGRSWRH